MIQIARQNREALLNQRAKVIWFTGLPCSGKTSLASSLEIALNNKGFATYFMDADVVRLGLNKDLQFSSAAREENIRRIAEVSALFVDAGIVVLCAFIAPQQSFRDNAKRIIGEANYREVFVDCPLEVCEERDVKGMYKKARKGDIKGFTGVDDEYEVPTNPDMTINTHELNLNKSVEKLTEWILPQISK